MFRVYFPDDEDLIFSPLPLQKRKPFRVHTFAPQVRRFPKDTLSHETLTDTLPDITFGELDLRKMGLDGDRTWAFLVDTEGFSPTQLKLSVDRDSGSVAVEGTSEWSSKDGGLKKSSSFSQKVKLPDGVNVDTVKSRVFAQGGLLLLAQREQKDKEEKIEKKEVSVREIPIEIVETQRDKQKVSEATEQEVMQAGNNMAKTKERTIELE